MPAAGSPAILPKGLVGASRAAWRRLATTPFGRDLALLLVLKLALLLSLYLFVLRPLVQPAQDAEATAAAIAGSATSHAEGGRP